MVVKMSIRKPCFSNDEITQNKYENCVVKTANSHTHVCKCQYHLKVLDNRKYRKVPLVPQDKFTSFHCLQVINPV